MLEPGWLRSASAIEGDQARRFRVAVLNDARAAPVGVQSIQQPRQQDRAGAVDAIEMRKVDIDRAAPVETRLGILHRPRHRRRMGQIERTGRDEVPSLPVAIGPDGNAHRAILEVC